MSDRELLTIFIEASKILCTANLYADPFGKDTLMSAQLYLARTFDEEVLKPQQRASWLHRNNLAVIGNGLYAPTRRGR